MLTYLYTTHVSTFIFSSLTYTSEFSWLFIKNRSENEEVYILDRDREFFSFSVSNTGTVRYYVDSAYFPVFKAPL